MKKFPAIKARASVVSETTSVDDEIFLQPWFMPKKIFLQIRTLLPSAQLARMKYYFEDYGCLRCARSNVVYRGNGLCQECSVVVRCRLLRALTRRFKKVGVAIPNEPILKFLGLKKMAQVSRRTYYRTPPGALSRSRTHR